jgi:predicted MPP superfamily phosphohydrolase
VILFIVLLVPVYIYLGFTLEGSYTTWLILGFFFLAIASIPFKKIFKSQLKIAYFSMGILNFLLTFAILKDLYMLISGIPVSPEKLFLFTGLCFSAGVLNAMWGPTLKKVDVRLKHLPSELEGFKIVQISDLHIGATTEKSYVEKLVRKINELDPHLICLTGDIGDAKTQDHQEEIKALNHLSSTYGKFFVTGNHEYYWNAHEWINSLKEVGITPLINETVIISHDTQKLILAGVPDPVSRLLPRLELSEELKKEDGFKLLLSHRPDIAEDAANAGFHLQLSGHTHGGQFFPWTLILRFMHKFYKGLYQVNGMWVYVNCGSAAWGPPLRLGTSSEITLIRLRKKS